MTLSVTRYTLSTLIFSPVNTSIDRGRGAWAPSQKFGRPEGDEGRGPWDSNDSRSPSSWPPTCVSKEVE